jgi:hypothetical protein
MDSFVTSWVIVSFSARTLLHAVSYTFVVGQITVHHQGSIPDKGRDFYLHHHVQIDLGPTQPHIQWAPSALSQGMKRPERETDHLPSSGADA